MTFSHASMLAPHESARALAQATDVLVTSPADFYQNDGYENEKNEKQNPLREG